MQGSITLNELGIFIVFAFEAVKEKAEEAKEEVKKKTE
jgi:hypothetical protein